MPILAIMRPIGLTRVVFAKVRPYEPFRDSCAATAADRSSKTRDAVLAMTLPLDAGVPLEFPMFCPIVTEPRFGHCIPSAPFTPRHCGTPNEKLPRSSQTATTTDAPSLAGAAAAPAGTAPTSAIININSGSNSSINSNISSGGVNSSNSTTSSTTINRTSSNAINSININSRNDRITSNNNSSSTSAGAATTATRTASSATP